MRWKKLGFIYNASGRHGWDRTHAYIPTVRRLNERVLRVYAAFLDEDRIGRVGYVDVDAEDPTKVLGVSERPVLDVGAPGAFDEHGVTPISLVEHGGATYLFYVGWQRASDVRYRLLTGLAMADDAAGTFKRQGQGPVLASTPAERYLRSAPSVRVEDGVWKAWYIAGDAWITVGGKSVPTYRVSYMESADGLSWPASGRTCIDFASPDEYGFGRPRVIKDGGLYKMFYSVRTKSLGYRLGYAESEDGRRWVRKDREIGLDVSPSGWDSEMICFGDIIDVDGRRYCFYNGNGYGASGFGAALLESR